MEKLFTARSNAEVALLKELIEKDDIPCTIRNEYSSNAFGEIPIIDCYPELWVLNDEDYPKAQALLDSWLSPERPAQAPDSWVCPNCGEKIEGQFASCWRCTETREEN